MIKVLLGSLVVIFIASYALRRFQSPPTFTESKLPAQTVIYLEHRGDIQNMGNIFKTVSENLKEEGTFLANAKIGVIYNDNPLVLLDRGIAARVIVGIFVPSSERDSAEEFQKKFPDYVLGELPEISTVKSITRFSTPHYTEMVDFARNNFDENLKNPIVIDYYVGSKVDTVGETETHILYGKGIPRWVQAKNSQSIKN